MLPSTVDVKFTRFEDEEALEGCELEPTAPDEYRNERLDAAALLNPLKVVMFP